MNLLHDAYTAILSGITHRTGNEIHWVDENGNPITVEPIDIEQETYRVRCYREDGSLLRETSYLKDKLHGKSMWWYTNGQKNWERHYHHGQLHGKFIRWYTDGQIKEEVYYYQDQRHGKHIAWYVNGQKEWEVDCHQGHRHGKYTEWIYNGCKILEHNYCQGQRHGKSVWWNNKDGTLSDEEYYINGNRATREKWEQHNNATT